ncbi:LuxR family transcriptional regulator [Aeromicrobium sp. Leaf350]|uniref:helix-turn-helix transcriptional regulator n=1 Tax=Aeromicrobium sp. Leaf350 TaxID=2876565 RepID=UPI001E5DCB2E|nr:LuxR family transcriptional regulator [Aeromicrobium sp. Leaf350]
MDQVHRRAALARITALARGDEGALLVHGEPGLGKSHLLRSAMDAMTIRTELVSAPAGESAIPLSGFSVVLDAMRGEHATSFGRHLELRSTTPAGLFSAAQDVLDLLHGLDLPPCLVLVDDLDSMDDVSRSLVGTMAAHLLGTGVRIVATARDGRVDGALAGLPAIELAPWSVGDLVDLALRHDERAEESTVRIMAPYAAGNPTILAEQLAALRPDQRAGDAWLTLPPRATPTLIEAVSCPSRGGQEAVTQLLEVAALAPLAHIQTLGEVHDDGTDAIEDLTDAGVLRPRGLHVTFGDQRLRSMLYWRQPARLRRERHFETLPRLAEHHDGDLATWHGSFASLGEDRVAELILAAIRLVDDQRVPEAIEFAERALRHTTRPGDHSAVLIRFCGHLLQVGEVGLAARYSERIQTSHEQPGLLLEAAVFKIVAQLFDRQRIGDDEAQALVALHAEAGVDRASDLLTLTAFYRAERWEVQEARHLIEPALTRVDEVSADTRSKVMTLVDILDAVDGRPGPPRTPSVDEVEPARLPPDVLLMRARALTLRERYPQARGVFHLVLNHPTQRQRVWSDLALYGTIGNEISAGEFQLARDAIATWGTSSPWVNRHTAAHTMIRAWHQYSLGATDTALEIVDAVVELASKESSTGLRARAYALRGAIGLLNGDPEGAVADLRRVTAMSQRFANPSLLRHWADYVEACVLVDRVQEAQSATVALERRLTKRESRWGALALARCRALLQPGEESLALFARAVDTFEWGEVPYEFGRTTAAFAERQESLGLANQARYNRIAAITAFEACGAHAWAARAAQAPEAAPTPSASLLDQLTPEQQEVVQCVLRGMRTREVAAAMFVSLRTVELRLTQVYRTLGVRSRVELMALLADRDQT